MNKKGLIIGIPAVIAAIVGVIVFFMLINGFPKNYVYMDNHNKILQGFKENKASWGIKIKDAEIVGDIKQYDDAAAVLFSYTNENNGKEYELVAYEKEPVAFGMYYMAGAYSLDNSEFKNDLEAKTYKVENLDYYKKQNYKGLVDVFSPFRDKKTATFVLGVNVDSRIKTVSIPELDYKGEVKDGLIYDVIFHNKTGAGGGLTVKFN